jgi:hypothetical protein
MSEWKPRVRTGLKWDSLNLTAEEGFLLSRLDGATSVDALTHLTGMPTTKIAAALDKLAESGAIEPAPARAAPAPPRPAPPPTQARVPIMTADASAEGDEAAAIHAALADMTSDELELPSLEGADTDEGAGGVDDEDALFDDARANANDNDNVDDNAVDAARAVDDAPAAEGSADVPGDSPVEEGAEKVDEAEAAVAEGNYRKLYETTLHDLPQEEREKKARTESGAVLMALCFDPVPQVIKGIMENPDVGFPHARLIARHHRTPQGLEALFSRNEFVRDGIVQRYLLANPMLQDAHFKKLLQPKRLAVVYQWALSRDLPEKNRQKVRNLLRSKWSTSEGEERANLIWATEGRVLTMVIGLPFDSQTTQNLCARTMHSVLLIQNLARFASSPPQLITHLLKQPAVKRQVHLRNMCFQHPNCPSNEKRKRD